MYRTMKGWTWIFFSCCMLTAFLVVYFVYPETKGVSSYANSEYVVIRLTILLRSLWRRSRSFLVAEQDLLSNRLLVDVAA